ncbi:MAG: helix-turn-helix transcriptional regulator [Clostridia bacterium]|nr:helix-turn-helix transcriptional regulator [Clostridia bacterium]
MDYYEIGQRIRKFRKAQGLSQETLAEKAGVSTTHMSHIETGNTKLSLSVFVTIASILQVRTDELLYDNYASERTTAIDSIAQILDSCSCIELRIIEDIVKAAKSSLDKNL